MKRKQVESKTKYMLAGVILVLVILTAKLVSMQIFQTEQFRTLARNNYIRIVPVFAPRGEIFDRDGEKLVTNRPIYTVSLNNVSMQGTTYSIVLERVGADNVSMAEELARILATDTEYVRKAGGDVGEDQDPEQNARLIGEQIKKKIAEHKTALENGDPLVLAVAYDPAVAGQLSGARWGAFGIKVEKQTDMLSKLVALLFPKGVFEEESPYAVERRVREEISGKKAYESVLVAEDIPLETVVQLREKQLELPGVVVDIQPVRDYPYDTLMSHALGYVQNIKSEQYQQHKDEGYLMNDLYGQNGLERVFEKYLRGEHGARQVEVDTHNRPVRDLGMKSPVPGNDLVLTVDLEVQAATEKALADGTKRAQDAGYKDSKAAAAVVLDVNTGGILAMASYPTYNPGVFANLTNTRWQELQESGALLNRAMSLYPPGSTFKMVTATAILENKVVDPDYRLPDPGYYMLGRRYNDWKPGGHGSVDMLRALQYSCDTYFWHFGRLAGVEAIAHYAREYGLGQSTGINLPGELIGAVPDPEHKYELVKSMLIRYNRDFARVRELNGRIEEVDQQLQQEGLTGEDKRRLERTRRELVAERDGELEKQLKKYEWDLTWQAYDTLNMSIGQGDNWYSPLQLANYVAAIANGGTLYKPYLVDKVISPSGEVVKEYHSEVLRRVDVSPETLAIIREGMHLVTVPPGGTAAGVFAGFKHTAAAKTGTAEVFDAQGNKKTNHALFVAFAPYEKPEIAVAVVLESGHSGSGYAGPIAREILDAYFGDDEAQTPAEDERPAGEAGGGVAPTPGGWQVVPDDIPALSWPGWERRPSEDPTQDERYRYYAHRLTRWQQAEQRRAASRQPVQNRRTDTAPTVESGRAGPEDPGLVDPGTGHPGMVETGQTPAGPESAVPETDQPGQRVPEGGPTEPPAGDGGGGGH